MRTCFYRSTALAAAGLALGLSADATAAERIKLDVSGFSQFWVVGLAQDFKDGGTRVQQGFNASAVDFKQNAEVCFVGSTVLDNGLTVGVNVQLEASGEDPTGIDESFLFLESDRLGLIQLGATDGASDALFVGAPNGGLSIDDEGDVASNEFFIDTVGFISPDSTNKTFTDDAVKATFLTPRVGGLQLGVSFTPQESGLGQRSPNYKANGSFRDAVSGGLNYNQVLENGFGIDIGAGIEYASTWATANGFDNDPNGTAKGILSWQAGAQFSFAGITIGGAYGKLNGPTRGGLAETGGVTNAQTTDAQFESRAWSIGATYETGPYKVGAEYVYTAEPGFNAIGSGEADRHVAAVSGTYLLGPGIRLIGGLFWFQENAENNVNAAGEILAGPSQQSGTDGGGGTLALTTSF